MPSLFEREAKKVVKELGKKDLKPVTSCHNSTQFRPFCLLRKKTRNILSCFWEKPPIPTDFSLLDILDPSSTDPELTHKGPFCFSDKVDGQLKAGVDVDTGLNVEVSGGAMLSHGSSLKMQTLTVPHATWTTLQKNRKLLNPEHSFLWECWSRGEDLYVVTEAVEVLNDTIINSISNMESDGKISFLGTSNVKSQGQGHISTKKSLSIPPGSILAYRTVKLLIKEKEWALNDTQHNLLAQSLEKKIVPQQLELVKSILEANFNQFHKCFFLLQPEFLSLLHGEDLDITLGLVEECGLKLQRAGQLLIWDPDEKNLLCALYGALSCLLSLAED
ncbi:gasdermin-C-like [Trichosurus vulpecula]|uniref:gasdermin-C-like n=1 Tax=Trichosurus vulpecula TaxID=9337 RepID=UPI00186B1743|nr:gasdermin-C-like [Trichosurus vulpecula]